MISDHPLWETLLSVIRFQHTLERYSVADSCIKLHQIIAMVKFIQYDDAFIDVTVGEYEKINLLVDMVDAFFVIPFCNGYPVP